MYLFQHTVVRVHGCFPQLFRVHFTQTFVTLGVYGVLRTATVGVDKLLALLVGPAILFHLAFGTKIKRWSSDVQVALLNHLREVAEEERHNQRVDVRTIDVGIGHDDYLLVAQLIYISFFAVLSVYTETDAQRLDDIVYFVTLECFVPHGFFHIQNLTAQRQNSLESTVTALLGGTTCRITLDEEQFAFFRVLAGAVRQFTRHTATGHR